MKKMYLVSNSWSNESGFQTDMQSLRLFEKYEDAKEFFEKLKENIKSRDYGWDMIEEDTDYYCEYLNGEYLYNHDLVRILELEVN